MLAVLLIPLGLATPKAWLLILAGSLLGLSLVFDLLRLIVPKLDDRSREEIFRGFRVCKPDEKGKISGMTVFMLGVCLVFLLFDRNVAFAGLGFAALASPFAGLVESNFGKIQIFVRSEKTWEGSLAFLSMAATIGFLLWSGGMLSLWTAVIGSLSASVVQSIPTGNRDSLTVPLISGAIMALL